MAAVPEEVRSFYARWNAREFGAALESLAPDVEWLDAPELPDSRGVLRGREAVRQLWDALIEPMPDLRIEPVEAEETPAGLLLEIAVAGTGAESGATTDAKMWTVLESGAGGLTRVRNFLDEAAAREAAAG